MATVLLYNLHPTKAAKLKMLCRTFFIDAVEVDPADYGKPIAVLLGESPDDGAEATEMFSEEMLYFADVNDGMLGMLLRQLRRIKPNIALKAVKTETNVHFTSAELYRELCAERAALSASKNGG